MHRILSAIAVFYLSGNSFGLARECRRLEQSQLVFFETESARGTAIYDAERQTLSTVSHNMKDLQPKAARRSCFRLRNLFGQTIVANGRLGLPERIAIPNGRNHGPYTCLGYSHFVIADGPLRSILYQDIGSRRERGRALLQASQSTEASAVQEALLRIFLPYAAQFPAADVSSFLQNLPLLLRDEGSVDRNSQTVALGEDFNRLASMSAELQTQLDGRWISCDGWYGASGSPVLDSDACIVGLLDQLDPGPAYWFRAFAPVGLIKITSVMERGRILPCDS